MKRIKLKEEWHFHVFTFVLLGLAAVMWWVSVLLLGLIFSEALLITSFMGLAFAFYNKSNYGGSCDDFTYICGSTFTGLLVPYFLLLLHITQKYLVYKDKQKE